MEVSKIVSELIKQKIEGKGNVQEALNYQQGIEDAIDFLQNKNELTEKDKNKITVLGHVSSKEHGDYTVNEFDCPKCGRGLRNGSPFAHDTDCCGYNWDFNTQIIGVSN